MMNDEKVAPVKLIDEKCDKDKGSYVEPAHLRDVIHSDHLRMFEKTPAENYLIVLILIISH